MVGEELRACREHLMGANCSVELPGGALMFVNPTSVNFVMNALRHCDTRLRGRHVICTSEFEPLIMRAVRRIPTQEHVHLKDKRELLASCPLSVTKGGSTGLHLKDLTPATVGQEVLIVNRTFLEVARHVSWRGDVTASTTDAHAGWHRNPRASPIEDV